jgi:prepilin-type N-terminal cleavage/methylation domain-containing protein
MRYSFANVRHLRSLRGLRQAGFTMIELMIVLVVFVLLVGGLYAMFGSTRAGAITDQAVKGTMGLVSAVSRNFPTPNFEGITALGLTKQAPKNFVAGTGSSATLRDPWGGTIAVASTTPFTTYTLTFPTVPSDECVPFVSALQSSFVGVRIGSTDVKTATAAWDRAAAETACAGATTLAVIYTGG